MHFGRCDVAIASHFRGVFICIFHPHFLQKSITQHLVYTSAALRAADKGARNANRPNCPKNRPTRHKRGGFRAKPLAKSRLLFFVFVVGKRNFLQIFTFRQRKTAPYASIGARLRVLHCLPPQGYAANRFRRRCVKGFISCSHLMTLSKITYFVT